MLSSTFKELLAMLSRAESVVQQCKLRGLQQGSLLTVWLVHSGKLSQLLQSTNSKIESWLDFLYWEDNPAPAVTAVDFVDLFTSGSYMSISFTASFFLYELLHNRL